MTEYATLLFSNASCITEKQNFVLPWHIDTSQISSLFECLSYSVVLLLSEWTIRNSSLRYRNISISTTQQLQPERLAAEEMNRIKEYTKDATFIF